MKQIKLNINGNEVIGFEGQTILNIALENGIEIPTLCHDDRVEIYGSCGICVVEVEGSPRLFRACASPASDGMVIKTNTERILKSRKITLELLLSDHDGDCRAPCALKCPAETDCQGYIKLIAGGEYSKALGLIKDKIPLPASVGRVCPHPCEEACRRELVEEPLAVCALKRFAADYDDNIIPDIIESGKKVAVIGGGPGGLSAAYFLRLYGREVSVYDAMPQMGGMLRYGIPEYRLPKKILQKEIDNIENTGVKFHNNIKIGRDITLGELRSNYDAVIIAAGAWSSMGLGCPGEELEEVIGGIDFLRDINFSNIDLTGKKIAVVGGGNTAMDACRTALRLGADSVYNIYRRTKNEMPAEKIEISEAEEEGVIFKNLTNPIEIISEENKIKAVRLQIMELGEPDSSGRRKPVEIPGKEEILEADTVIVAIGQKLNAEGFEEIERTKWGTIIADENNFATNLDGVFAIGDATNNGADIAVSAIGEAKKAAGIINLYLTDGKLPDVPENKEIILKSEKTPEDFSEKEKSPRVKTNRREPDERRGDFLEIDKIFTEEEAKREASRCLECGCGAFNRSECKLIDYANKYKARPDNFKGELNKNIKKYIQDAILHDPGKCILCGLCVRICGGRQSKLIKSKDGDGTLLGLTNRGFHTVVNPDFAALSGFACKTCGKCAEACPTGALYKL
ncbi:MAG: FAD-dependent oxidoreductase [Oscillospiraceae bacterium]|nr:FAD-dependent oxidoreductase [Oscillospiraceae bacterium]